MKHPGFINRAGRSLVIWWFISSSGIAASISTCDEAGLRTALNGGGTVTFACDGTITLSSPITITNDTVLDGSGRSVTVSGGGTVRVFNVSTGVSFTVINVGIANGQSISGGGFFNDGGNLRLVSCLLSNNTALGDSGSSGSDGVNGATNVYPPGDGGNGGPGLPGETGRGGAICNLGFLSVSNSTFIGNSAQGGSGGSGGNGGIGGTAYDQFGRPRFGGHGGNGGLGGSGGCAFGGGIYNSGTAAIDVSGFLSNRAFGGDGAIGGGGGSGGFGNLGGSGGDGGMGGMVSGAALHNEGSLTLHRCTLEGNEGHGGMGGMGGPGAYPISGGNGGNGGVAGGSALANGTNASILVTNSTLTGNFAAGGDSGVGGLFGGFACPSFAGNGGDAAGGALANAGAARLVNCTVWNNSVAGGLGEHNVTNAFCPMEVRFGTNGAAVASSIVNSTGNLLLINTIIGSSGSSNNCVGSMTDGGHNLCSDGSASFTAPGSQNNTDPILGPLANNGGPTQTLALLPGSPAIDEGDDQLCPTTDQRGVPRPQQAHCDIGAFEQTFLSIRRSPSGNLILEYHGVPQQAYALQESVDSLIWNSFQTKSATAEGMVTFDATNSVPAQFFRVVLP